MRLLLGSGERRLLASAAVPEPLPNVGVVRPFLLLDAPQGRLWGQEKRIALCRGQAAGDGFLGTRHQFLGVRKNFPPPRRLVFRRGDDALAVGTESGAQHNILMPFERLADLLAGLGVPQPRRVVPRRRDDALAVGAERRGRDDNLMASERRSSLMNLFNGLDWGVILE